MDSREAEFEIRQQLQRQPAQAIAFFVLSAGLLTLALTVAWLLTLVATPQRYQYPLTFIVAFACSSALLAAGSVQLVRASAFVRMERQQEFRRCLGWALGLGTIFVSVQAYALESLIQQSSADIATGLKQAAFAFIFLHAVHVVVALLFVVFVFLRALADRYDHEYSWGVTFCGWFWHGLGVVWVAIMGLFIVAGSVVMGP